MASKLYEGLTYKSSPKAFVALNGLSKALAEEICAQGISTLEFLKQQSNWQDVVQKACANIYKGDPVAESQMMKRYVTALKNLSSYLDAKEKADKKAEAENLRQLVVNHLTQCPITYAVFVKPVVAADGYTYEKTAIEKWFQEHDTSPMTGEVISTVLYPNMGMKDLVEFFNKKGIFSPFYFNSTLVGITCKKQINKVNLSVFNGHLKLCLSQVYILMHTLPTDRVVTCFLTDQTCQMEKTEPQPVRAASGISFFS